MTPPVAQPAPRWLQIGTGLLLAIAIVIGWGSRMSWGLWLDETYVVWQVKDGVGAIVRHKLGEPAQSVLFGYLEALFFFPGSPHMEAWLRLPAALGALACCFFGYRLAESMVGKGAGTLALLTLAGSPAMMVYSTQARPYTCAAAACLATAWTVQRWLTERRWTYALGAAISFALTVHLHLLFAVFGVVPAFMIGRQWRRRGDIDGRQLAAMAGVFALLLLPLVPLLRRLSGAPDSSALPPPHVRELLDAWMPGTVLLALIALAALLLLPSRRPALAALKTALPARPVELAFFWLLVPPLLLFAASRALHKTLLIDRYVLHVVGAEALIVAALFRGFDPIFARVMLFAVFITIPVQHGVLGWSQTEGFHSWRPALAAVKRIDPDATAPLFVQSGHAASNAIDWPHAIERGSLYYSQLVAYPVANRAYPLPYAVREDVRGYVRRIADTELAGAPLIFLAGIPTHPTVEWVRQFFESRGYASAYVVRQGVCLIALRKSPESAP